MAFVPISAFPIERPARSLGNLKARPRLRLRYGYCTCQRVSFEGEPVLVQRVVDGSADLSILPQDSTSAIQAR
jgi:hypothetical protein